MYRNDEEDAFLRGNNGRDPKAYLYRTVALGACAVLLGMLAWLVTSVMLTGNKEQNKETGIRMLDPTPAVTVGPGEYAFSASAAAMPVNATQMPVAAEAAAIAVPPVQRRTTEYEEREEPEERPIRSARPVGTQIPKKTEITKNTAKPTKTSRSYNPTATPRGEELPVSYARSVLAEEEEEAEQGKVAGPVKTPKPTKTPRATRTPKPTKTPVPTATPRPTKTPKPTKAPVITPSPTPYYKTLLRHDSSSHVTRLQERLMELGYLDIDEPTDYFGTATENAVKIFQRQHELSVDGQAGQETQTLLYSKDAQKYCLRIGVEGGDVKALQQQLCELGYLDEKRIDSVYSETTVKAVKEFQTRNGLSPDGLAGEKTLEILYSDDAKISYSFQKKQNEAEASVYAAAAKKKKTATPRPSPTPKKETRIDKFLAAARSKLGCEYILGDRGPKTFDCSGFVYWCLREAGVSVTRLNAAGFSNKSSWKKITKVENLEPGDILFYRSDKNSHVNHCGIYIGGGNMIDASSAHGKIVKRPMSAYWKRNFVCARRPW